MRQITFDPWYGEFGWEVMTWIPACRRVADDYDRVEASSFAEMSPLYDDFIDTFTPHGGQRSLTYPKRYRVAGRHRRYGRPEQARLRCDLLIHARGIRRKAAINYRRWPELVRFLSPLNVTIGYIGSPPDGHYDGGADLRDMEMNELIDVIAAAPLVVGVSSGLMHLAAACGTDLLVWGDRRTYFGETLEMRYKETWNPHDVAVAWLDADDWQPEPSRIVTAIEKVIA